MTTGQLSQRRFSASCYTKEGEFLPLPHFGARLVEEVFRRRLLARLHRAERVGRVPALAPRLGALGLRRPRRADGGGRRREGHRTARPLPDPRAPPHRRRREGGRQTPTRADPTRSAHRSRGEAPRSRWHVSSGGGRGSRSFHAAGRLSPTSGTPRDDLQVELRRWKCLSTAKVVHAFFD